MRHSMIVSERMPPAKAPGSLDPFGRWSVPITSTVSVEVTMFPRGQGGGDRVGDRAALDLGTDQEQHGREQQPPDHEQDQVFEDPPGRDLAPGLKPPAPAPAPAPETPSSAARVAVAAVVPAPGG